jgi:hypothetical protein
VYKQFNGVVLDAEEGKRIAETLGPKKVRKLLFVFAVVVQELIFVIFVRLSFFKSAFQPKHYYLSLT